MSSKVCKEAFFFFEALAVELRLRTFEAHGAATHIHINLAGDGAADI
jgi:hypothetical protein